MTTTATTQVLPHNFREETKIIQKKLVSYPNICIDTEFNRFKRPISQDMLETEIYEDLKYNISYTNLREVGITLCDDAGTVGGTWRFDMLASRKAGIRDNDCIRFRYFASALENIMDDFRGRVKWITFSGYYDIAHLIALVTKKPLPETMDSFVELVGNKLGRVYDLKLVAKGHKGFGHNKFLGLQTLADKLGVKRVGKEHDAASDSLLTAAIFAKFMELNWISESNEGFLYLLPKKICCVSCIVEPTTEDNYYQDKVPYISGAVKPLDIQWPCRVVPLQYLDYEYANRRRLQYNLYNKCATYYPTLPGGFYIQPYCNVSY